MRDEDIRESVGDSHEGTRKTRPRVGSEETQSVGAAGRPRTRFDPWDDVGQTHLETPTAPPFESAMPTSIDLVTVRVSFLQFPGWDPLEMWHLASEPGEETEVDERELEEALRDAFVDAGGANTLSFQRSVTWGGWGVEGLRVLDIVINVGSGIASTVLWEAIKALWQKHLRKPPAAAERNLSRSDVVAEAAALPRTAEAETTQSNAEVEAGPKPNAKVTDDESKRATTTTRTPKVTKAKSKARRRRR